LRGANRIARNCRGAPNIQPNAFASEIISRGDSVAILEKQKAAPKDGFSN
jgi:hypothetical protein